MSTPTTFGIVGGGWRSDFFQRVARAAPDRLRVAGVVTRSAEKGEAVTAAWGTPTYRTAAELVAAQRPDFVIASVSWPAMPGVVRELVDLGVPVMAETPPAPDLDGLRSLWSDVGGRGSVSVAEQYMLMPGHAARLAVVRDGVIGTPTSVEVASTHLYHAVSIIRTFLDAGLDDAVVTARAFSAPLLDPLSPSGWDPEAAPQPRATTIATLDLGGGRMGLYDFVDNQWWNPVRARRLVVRGSVGEIVDDTVVRFLEPTVPVTSHLEYRRTGVDMNLEGNDLVHVSFDGRVVYRNPWVGTRLSEDDIAVASILEAQGAFARDEGPTPYGLAEACQDHALGLAIGESARTGRDVRVTGEPWAAA